MKDILTRLILLVAVCGVCVHIGLNCGRKQARIDIVEKVDTLIVHDTITALKPISVTRRVLDTITLPADTIRLRDTLFVMVERESVTWLDSLCEVHASGVKVNIDSVRHFTQKEIITKTIIEKEKIRSRWGVGVTAGYGATKDGLSPYVGVGIQYNILSW